MIDELRNYLKFKRWCKRRRRNLKRIRWERAQRLVWPEWGRRIRRQWFKVMEKCQAQCIFRCFVHSSTSSGFSSVFTCLFVALVVANTVSRVSVFLYDHFINTHPTYKAPMKINWGHSWMNKQVSSYLFEATKK